MAEEIGDVLELDQLALHPGDVMLVNTDGITEATDTQGQMYSDKKLADIFEGLGTQPVEEIRAGILGSLEGYTCKDDVTPLLIKRDLPMKKTFLIIIISIKRL